VQIYSAMNSSPIDWDDLRLFLAVHRAGSLSAAARTIGLSQPTLGRRIAALERVIGKRLFERRPDGYRATPAGEALAEKAEEMDEAAQAILRQTAAEDAPLTGTVRISTGEWLGRFLLRHGAELLDGLDGIELEIASSFEFMNLSRREADIALRNALPAGGDLVSRVVARPSIAAYATPAYIAAHPDALGEGRWKACDFVGFDEAHQNLRTARWLLAQRDGRMPRVRCTAQSNILEAVKAGCGIGLIPCYIGDAEPGLTRASEPIPALQSRTWIIYHRDYRQVPRITTLADRIDALFERHGRLTVSAADG